MLGTIAELAQRVGGRTAGGSGTQIARIAAIDEAGPDALTFATTPGYFVSALASRAGAILVDEALAVGADADCAKPLILVPSARVALAELLRSFERPRKRGPFRHPTAAIEDSAAIGDGVYIGPHVTISARARIGDRAVLEAGVFVGSGAVIGSDAFLRPRATVMDDCVAGDRVTLHPGAVIGSEGFGYVFVDGRFVLIPQVGNVVLGDDVEIGANTCIDRAQIGSTQIGEGTKIDNLVQVGHNCRIGRHTAIAALCGMAGSTVIGDYVLVGGQSAFKGHVTVGSRVKIFARAGVWGDIPDDAVVAGNPARPHMEELRREVMVRSLPKLLARVDALEKKLKE